MITIVQGVDASYDTLTDAEAKRLRAAGAVVFAQCLWTGGEQPPPRVINLRIAHDNGFVLMGYISVNSQTAGQYHCNKARSGIPDDLWNALALVPVDVELDNIPVTTVRGAVEVLASWGKRRAIYTSYNAWANKMGNPQDFTDCLLWNAYWDGAGDIDFASLPFGGWTIDKVVGEQWSGGMNVEGLFADRDSFAAELLVPPPPEEPMSNADKIELAVRRMNDNLIALILAGKLQDVAQALGAMGVKSKP